MNADPVAIVTGASRGIGAAAALELASRGHDLVLTARTGDLLESVAEQVKSLGRNALVLPGDLADMRFVESIVPRAVERWGRIDVLVNNAAWRELVTMRTITLESWEKTLRASLTAPAFLARYAAEQMEARGRGVIINISSAMSQQAAGLSPAYVACKGALDALTYELASLYGQSGIRVLAVNPGAIDTEMSRDLAMSQGKSVEDELRAFSEDMIMLRRWGTPAEVARVIAFLASDDASYVNGTTILVDGGWVHQHLPLSLRRKQDPDQFA